MRTIFSIGLLSTLIVQPACTAGSSEGGAAGSAPDSTFDAVQIAVASGWRQHIDAAKRKDADAIGQLYAPNVVYVLSSGEEVRGWPAVDSLEVAGLAVSDVIEAEHRTYALRVADGVAYELGTVIGSIRPRGQEAGDVTYTFMAMWERQPDGSWRIRYLVGS